MSPDPGNPVLPDQPSLKPTPQPIWTVAHCHLLNEAKPLYPRDYHAFHCVAFYYTLQEAIACLPCLDTEAGYYTHIVIEAWTPGYHAMANSEKWYCRNANDDGWQECDKPDSLINVVNFGLG